MAAVDFHSSATFSATVSLAFKEWYKDGAPPDLTIKDHPGYGMLPKGLWKGGNPYIYQFKIANMAGRSKEFSRAKTNDSPVVPKEIQLTTVHDYARTTFDGETLLRLKSDPQGFFQYLRDQTDSAFMAMGDVLAHEFYRDGTAKVALIASESSNVFTLSDKAEIKAFELNQRVEFWDVSATTVRQSDTVANGRISAVDHEAGKFTLPATYSTNFSFTLEAGVDFVAFDGDLTASGGALTIKGLAGLEAWNPASVTATAFYGLDRSVAPAYLAGGRQDFTSNGYGIRESLMVWCARTLRYGGKYDMIIVNPENFVELEKELTSVSYAEIRVTDASSPVQIGYRAIELACAWGTVLVVSDADCPMNLARGVTFSELEFLTVDRVGPWILDLDGQRMLRETDEDSYELRVGYYGQMACYMPKRFSRLVLPTVSA